MEIRKLVQFGETKYNLKNNHMSRSETARTPCLSKEIKIGPGDGEIERGVRALPDT